MSQPRRSSNSQQHFSGAGQPRKLSNGHEQSPRTGGPNQPRRPSNSHQHFIQGSPVVNDPQARRGSTGHDSPFTGSNVRRKSAANNQQTFQHSSIAGKPHHGATEQAFEHDVDKTTYAEDKDMKKKGITRVVNRMRSHGTVPRKKRRKTDDEEKVSWLHCLTCGLFWKRFSKSPQRK